MKMIIYEPKGKAREYSPLAANLYSGCDHGCLYCYAPKCVFKEKESFHSIVEPRRNVINEFEKDCRRYTFSNDQVLFSFTSDPYNVKESEYRITRDALKLAFKYSIPVSVLSKGGKRILNDIDIISKFGKHIHIGATLTFDNDLDSIKFEPKAALPRERIETLVLLYKAGIRTWVSFEPVIIPEQSLTLMQMVIDSGVSFIKVGKVNNYQCLDKDIDWSYFLSKSVDLLRKNKIPFYVKNDLRNSAPDIKLYGNEVLADEFNAIPFEKELELF